MERGCSGVFCAYLVSGRNKTKGVVLTFQCVLQLQNLVDKPCLLLHFYLVLNVSWNVQHTLLMWPDQDTCIPHVNTEPNNTWGLYISCISCLVSYYTIHVAVHGEEIVVLFDIQGCSSSVHCMTQDKNVSWVQANSNGDCMSFQFNASQKSWDVTPCVLLELYRKCQVAV